MVTTAEGQLRLDFEEEAATWSTGTRYQCPCRDCALLEHDFAHVSPTRRKILSSPVLIFERRST